MTLRSQINLVLSNNLTQLIVLSLIVALTFFMNSAGYYLGVAYILVVLWASGWDWQSFGFTKPANWGRLFLMALTFAVLMLIIGFFLITPLVVDFTGEKIYLGVIENIRGNPVNYILLLVLVWTIVAFGEEIVFRGYLIKRISTVFGDSWPMKWLTVVFSAILFGLAHRYQGSSGMIITGFYGLALGTVFITNKNNLWLTVLTHAIFDTLLLTIILFSLDQRISDVFAY